MHGLSRIRGPIPVSSFIILLHCRPLIFCAHGVSHDGLRRVFDPRDRSTRASEEGRASIVSDRFFDFHLSEPRKEEGNSSFRTTLRPRSAGRNLSDSAVSFRFSLVCCERAGPSLVDHGVCVYVLVAVSRRHQAVILYTNIIKFYHYNIGSLFFFLIKFMWHVYTHCHGK